MSLPDTAKPDTAKPYPAKPHEHNPGFAKSKAFQLKRALLKPKLVNKTCFANCKTAKSNLFRLGKTFK